MQIRLLALLAGAILTLALPLSAQDKEPAPIVFTSKLSIRLPKEARIKTFEPRKLGDTWFLYIRFDEMALMAPGFVLHYERTSFEAAVDGSGRMTPVFKVTP